MNLTLIDFDIIGPALLAGILVTLTHIPLGQRVLKRGIIFLDLAVAQVAGLGIIIAHSFHAEPNNWQVQIIAITAAIIGVVMLNYTDKRWPEIQEAIIGSLFVLASSAGILLLAASPQGSEQLRNLLIGQILWISYDQLIPVALLYSAVLFSWFKFRRHNNTLIFYLLFAITITASVQLIGIYLVFATLILPALATRKMKSNALKIGYLTGITAYLLGLSIASLVDLPAGGIIVFSLALISLFIMIIQSKIKH